MCLIGLEDLPLKILISSASHSVNAASWWWSVWNQAKNNRSVCSRCRTVSNGAFDGVSNCNIELLIRLRKRFAFQQRVLVRGTVWPVAIQLFRRRIVCSSLYPFKFWIQSSPHIIRCYHADHRTVRIANWPSQFCLQVALPEKRMFPLVNFFGLKKV